MIFSLETTIIIKIIRRLFHYLRMNRIRYLCSFISSHHSASKSTVIIQKLVYNSATYHFDPSLVDHSKSSMANEIFRSVFINSHWFHGWQNYGWDIFIFKYDTELVIINSLNLSCNNLVIQLTKMFIHIDEH